MFNGWKAGLVRVWYWVRWPLALLVVGYVVLVFYRVGYFFDQDKVAADVAAIHANKLTREDVYGPLPPAPDSIENNKTLAGIDANNNGIRDDVEIAIYEAHKDSAKTTAAMLQYAKALQMEFTSVYNSETLVAVIQQQDRASLCVGSISRKEEIADLVFNTEERQKFSEELYRKYMTSYGLPNRDACDLQL